MKRAVTDFRILGPIEVSHEGRHVQLGAAKERALLARLLLSANRVVSVDRLLDDLWEGDPPESGSVSLRVHVSRLRQKIEPDPRHPRYVKTVRGAGYLLARES